MSRPSPREYASHFHRYVELVPESTILESLEAQIDDVRRVLAGVAGDRELFSYGPGKWTIRQVVGHMSDVERVFGYRALAISRHDKTPLPGFDENVYVERSRFNHSTLVELTADLVALRVANLRMFKTFHDDQWACDGIANGNSITVRAIAFVMAGHVRHHLRMLHERYQVAAFTT